MARIVVVHGVGQQLEGEHTLHARLFPALRDGMRAGGADVKPNDVEFPCYGQLFRPAAEVLSSEPWLDAADVGADFEQELLLAWWSRAAATYREVIPPEEEALARAPKWSQRALSALSRSRFFAGLADRAMIGDLRQVRSYFTDPATRLAAQDTVCQHVSSDTRVLIGHSLGSVVAYEALCRHSHWPVRAFVTLGSPLGLRHLIFDRLQPTPVPCNPGLRGSWPGSVDTWANIADSGDVVAAVEDLRPLFSHRIKQIRVYNGAHAHDMRPYLTDRATGEAIAEALSGG